MEQNRAAQSTVPATSTTIPLDAKTVDEVLERLEQGIKDVYSSNTYRAYLSTMAKLHDYSFNNVMLILLQRPDAHMIAGFHSWPNNFGRHVKKGEKGIKILAPVRIKKTVQVSQKDKDGRPMMDKDGKIITGPQEVHTVAFRVVSVFDVAQTEGKELPTLKIEELRGTIPDFERWQSLLVGLAPCPVYFTDVPGDAKGSYIIKNQTDKEPSFYGKIDFLGGSGEVEETLYYVSEKQYKKKIRESQEIGRPIEAREITKEEYAAELARYDVDDFERERYFPGLYLTAPEATPRIEVQQGMSEAQTLKTLIHEIAHAYAHHTQEDRKGLSRSDSEVQAESTAFVVCDYLGLDTGDYSFPYVAEWGSDKKPAQLKENLAKVQEYSSTMIESIQRRMEDAQGKEYAIETTQKRFAAIDAQFKRLGERSGSPDVAGRILANELCCFAGLVVPEGQFKQDILAIGTRQTFADIRAAFVKLKTGMEQAGRGLPLKDKIAQARRKAQEHNSQIGGR